MDFINEEALFQKAIQPALNLLRENMQKVILDLKDQFKDAEITVSAFDIKVPEFKVKIKILS